ncbi:Nucleoside-diphosphate-sugar epimerase [Flavobacterium terrae]|uniref:Nucleoside-diphosphate-sugar epimerase n=2 Tax=Flavobacterium terrae TaxID=415425 RepID=A0A1M6AL63_9FLAO|nr:Nucleoside-diphosphate-sugar epimerase [Flavobacterium terrae]
MMPLLLNIEFLEMQKISVLGCGWLGLPLSQKLIESGFVVKGSTTSSEKVSQLEDAGINPFVVSLTENSIEGSVEAFLDESEVLIINIPPKLRSGSTENFVAKIEILIQFLEKSSIKKVLFVSSTSVYGNQEGILTEEIIPEPITESGKQLLQVEKLLLTNPNFKTTILRFGGLIGEDRHPVKHLAGKENLDNPDAPINFIHQKDCIEIIKTICSNELIEVWGETFNAVAPFHPSRKDYYVQKAKEMNLALPKFSESIESTIKIIASDKLIKRIGHQFDLDLYR